MSSTSPPVMKAAPGEMTQRQFFDAVFKLMALGLALTALVAYALASDVTVMSTLFNTVSSVDSSGETVTSFAASGWWWLAAALQLVMVIAISWRGLGKNMSLAVGVPMFAFFAVLNGITIAPVLYAYAAVSVAKVFFITAITFLGCAFYGATTKRDMTDMGSFFLYALFGLLVALLMNLFFQAPFFDYVVSIAAVLLFAALTAYDRQMLRMLYEEGGSREGLVVFGALSFYLDFLNMFLHLLRLFGIKVPGHGD